MRFLFNRLFFYLTKIFSLSILVITYAHSVTAPTLKFAWYPSTIASGETTHREWTTTNADYCIGDNGSSVGTSGVSKENVQTESKTVTMTCYGAGGSVAKTITLTVIPANRTPIITNIPNKRINENEYINIQPTVSDPDGDSLRFSITNRPSWASFSSYSGRLRGTPTYQDAGTYGPIRITVSDGSLSDYDNLSITVYNILETSTLTSPESDDSISNGLCFEWEAAIGASHYTVQVSSDTNFDQNSHRWILRDVTSTSACWSTNFIANPTAGNTPTTLPNGQYYWRIKSLDNETFATDPYPNATFTEHRAFTMQTPAPTLEFAWHPESILSGETTHREWTATNADYCIGDDGSDVGTSGVSNENAHTQSKEVTMTCHGSGGSVVKTITLNVLKNASLITPSIDDTVDEALCFEWEAAEGASHYTVQVSSDTNFDQNSHRWVLRDMTSTAACWGKGFAANPTAVTTPDPLPDGQYYWRIKSLDNDTFATDPYPKSTFTEHRAFTVQAAPNVPDKVTRVFGPDEAGANTFFTITWDEMPHADSYTVLVKSGAAGEAVYQKIEGVESSTLDVSHSAEEVIIVRVQACNVNGCGAESGARIVNVLAGIDAPDNAVIGQKITITGLDTAVAYCTSIDDISVAFVYNASTSVATFYSTSELTLQNWQCFDASDALVQAFSAPITVNKLAAPLNLMEQ